MRQRRPCFALLSLLFACGPGDPGGSDTEPLPATGGDATGTAPAECPADLEPFATHEEYAAALAEATCAKLAACDCSGVPSTCVEDQTAKNIGRNKVYLAAGSVFDPLCARKLVLRHEWTSCDVDEASPCGTCEDFVGTRAEGDTCDFIADIVDPCGPHLFCNGGVCTGPVPPVDGGDKCREGEQNVGFCGADQICDFDQNICVPRPQLGDPCRDGWCGGLDLWCDTSDSPTGICRKTRPAGEPCSNLGQCDNLACVDNVCSADPRYCVFNNN
ncbi:hypothetical protein [Nannocystis punicea]|uniref:Dickkopf N-terminal cysteine-rich domain-containing protein n=1 Tax=Nannocystis punicea TaxID=2995304 RepID=A0ABY7HD01_9BACT|nr:hypothetical protein [Nannocystis poenicansa]WAS96993.1 hypothetical protein O0S08_12660 [Nannocystis poenicansa]